MALRIISFFSLSNEVKDLHYSTGPKKISPIYDVSFANYINKIYIFCNLIIVQIQFFLLNKTFELQIANRIVEEQLSEVD